MESQLPKNVDLGWWGVSGYIKLQSSSCTNGKVLRHHVYYIDYSCGTSTHALEALLIHLHKLCAYKLHLCQREVEETNNLSKGFMG